jgi:hypothetical protein
MRYNINIQLILLTFGKVVFNYSFQKKQLSFFFSLVYTLCGKIGEFFMYKCSSKQAKQLSRKLKNLSVMPLALPAAIIKMFMQNRQFDKKRKVLSERGSII